MSCPQHSAGSMSTSEILLKLIHWHQYRFCVSVKGQEIGRRAFLQTGHIYRVAPVAEAGSQNRWSYWHSKIIIDRPHYDVWRLNLLVFFVPLPIGMIWVFAPLALRAKIGYNKIAGRVCYG